MVESEHPGSGVRNVTLYVCKCEMAAKYVNESPVETEVMFVFQLMVLILCPVDKRYSWVPVSSLLSFK